MEENQLVSVNVGCSACQVQLDAGDSSQSSTSSVTYKATETTTVQISISSSTSETISTSIMIVDDQELLSQRPSPQTSIDVVESNTCASPSACMDMHRGNLKTILSGGYDSLGFDTGGVETGSEEYYGFEVQADETIELTLHHASDAVRFEFYMQTETAEQLLDAVIESITGTNPSLLQDAVYLPIEEDGRIIVKVSTSAPFSA